MNANNFHKYVKKVPAKSALDGTEIVYVGNADPARANRTTTRAIANLTANGGLKKFDGMRAQAIAVSAVYFGSTFGVTAEPQAMSDRWNAIAAGTYTGLADFINATVAD